VLGCTNTSAFRQPDQVRDNHAQRKRSATLTRARVPTLVDGEPVTQGEDLELEGGSD
jgi:hypothetical protein